MSTSRLQILAYQDQGTLHEMWRCHNKEHLLHDKSIKSMYLDCMLKALHVKGICSTISVHAYCTMDNHIHMMISYEDGIDKLSNFMRYKNSIFGKAYNKKHNRTGKVANERPKTQLIENPEHQMRVHFYIEANPLRAKITTLKQLKHYKYSSYKFYAHGITDEFSKLLTPPNWYLDLGTTNKQRQEQFRALFKKYVEHNIDPSKEDIEKQTYIGSSIWVTKLKNLIQAKKPKLRLVANRHDPPT